MLGSETDDPDFEFGSAVLQFIFVALKFIIAALKFIIAEFRLKFSIQGQCFQALGIFFSSSDHSFFQSGLAQSNFAEFHFTEFLIVFLL